MKRKKWSIYWLVRTVLNVLAIFVEGRIKRAKGLVIRNFEGFRCGSRFKSLNTKGR